jgi:shikimate kinase
MGSGKTSVAPLLADLLRLSWIDLDSELLKLTNYSSIAQIISEAGEPHFRELESQVAKSFREASDIVIATGGGVIGNPQNIASLRDNGGVIVFLDTSFTEVLKRITDRSSRPLLRDTDRALQLYNSRLNSYQGASDIVVNTDGKTPLDVATEIVRISQGGL